MTKEQEDEMFDSIEEDEALPSAGYSKFIPCGDCTTVVCDELGRCGNGPAFVPTDWSHAMERIIREAPDSRPQDGRVCNCEDAPCCGCYDQ